MVAEGLPAQLACRVLDVSESGFYAWRSRAPSERAIRHSWLTDLIRQIHVDFRGVYGYRACTPSSPSATASRSASKPCGC
jgi:hypothetical protein